MNDQSDLLEKITAEKANIDKNEWTLYNVHIFKTNEGIDLIYLPRINTVDGITDEHCRMYGYKVMFRSGGELNIICYNE